MVLNTSRSLLGYEDDQVLFVDLGPAGARGDRVITALGMPYTVSMRRASSCNEINMSAATATPFQTTRALPDYLPARMINEFVYCPRLFYYEQVQGVFVESADTIEGSVQHRRVDKEGAGPAPDAAGGAPVIARSITLSSSSTESSRNWTSRSLRKERPYLWTTNTAGR